MNSFISGTTRIRKDQITEHLSVKNKCHLYSEGFIIFKMEANYKNRKTYD